MVCFSVPVPSKNDPSKIIHRAKQDLNQFIPNYVLFIFSDSGSMNNNLATITNTTNEKRLKSAELTKSVPRRSLTQHQIRARQNFISYKLINYILH